MVQQSTWGADQQIDALFEPQTLGPAVHPANEQPDCLIVEVADLFGNLVDLDSQFPGGRDDDDPSTVFLLELEAVEQLETRDHVGEGFAGASLGCTQHISPFEQVGQGPGLDVRHLAVVVQFQSLLAGLRQLEVCEALLGKEPGWLVSFPGSALGIASQRNQLLLF